MERQDRYEKLALGELMEEFAGYLHGRLAELEPMAGLPPDQLIEREHLRLAYLQIEDELKHFGTVRFSPQSGVNRIRNIGGAPHVFAQGA